MEAASGNPVILYSQVHQVEQVLWDLLTTDECEVQKVRLPKVP